MPPLIFHFTSLPIQGDESTLGENLDDNPSGPVPQVVLGSEEGVALNNQVPPQTKTQVEDTVFIPATSYKRMKLSDFRRRPSKIKSSNILSSILSVFIVLVFDCTLLV